MVPGNYYAAHDLGTTYGKAGYDDAHGMGMVSELDVYSDLSGTSQTSRAESRQGNTVTSNLHDGPF